MKYDQAIIRASSHFLTKQLPEDWVEWEQEWVDNFLENHMMLGMAWDIVDLWDCIETLANDFVELTEESSCNP